MTSAKVHVAHYQASSNKFSVHMENTAPTAVGCKRSKKPTHEIEAPPAKRSVQAPRRP